MKEGRGLKQKKVSKILGEVNSFEVVDFYQFSLTGSESLTYFAKITKCKN